MRKAINELVGKTGKGYKVILDAIENYREKNSDAELTRNKKSSTRSRIPSNSVRE